MFSKSSTLRLEITLALIIKVMLLVGLWFVIFRFPGHHPGERPDIAAQLLAPAGLQPAPADSPTSDSSETSHVRR
ncbi:MAG: cytochrome oxidase putative small subunit CydP [Methylococcus sp.]